MGRCKIDLIFTAELDALISIYLYRTFIRCKGEKVQMLALSIIIACPN